MDKYTVFPNLLHGGDYNPEQWLHMPEILEKDIQYFKEARINTVSVGIFSWAKLEPQEGQFDFDWLEQIVNRLYDNGVSVILATPSGARPKWLADKYPEVLRVDEARRRDLFGGRHNHCYTSPVYREKVRTINTRLAEQFDRHPAVLMWHISNEYGGECHCPLCQDEFGSWLRDKYQSIDELNKRWCTTFWSHTYNSFDQIESPSSRGEHQLHALNLDWKRFVTDRTTDFAQAEVKALRDAGSEKPTTVNLMYNYEGLDYHKFADAADIISWDNYPTWHKESPAVTAMDSGMQHDLMRSLKKKPFLLMESCPTATNWQGVSKLKQPGILKAASLQSIAHGSDSVLYFQIRQSQGASEKFHGAVIDHYGGNDTRVFKEVSEVGGALAILNEVGGSGTRAEAAIVYDWNNRWALEDAQGPRNKGLYYKECVEKSYWGMRKQGINVDMIGSGQDFSDYKLLAAPMQYLFDTEFAGKARRFVENGGIFLLTYWSGIVDECDRCYLGGTPHGLLDVMGLRSTEIDVLYDWERNHAVPVPDNAMRLEQSYECRYLCDLVEVSTAEVLMTYGADFYKGMPAFTRNSYGRGRAYYVCADMEPAFYDQVYPELVAEAGIHCPVETVPEGIEITTRENERAEYLFVQNFTTRETAVEIPEQEYELLYGNYDGSIKNYDTVVFKRMK